jgi:hypothetical protein
LGHGGKLQQFVRNHIKTTDSLCLGQFRAEDLHGADFAIAARKDGYAAEGT